MRRPYQLAILTLFSMAPAFAAPALDSEFGEALHSVNGHSLALNGVGHYRRFIFSIYKVYLYLEIPSHEATQILNSSQLKFARMRFMRDVSALRIQEAWRDEFEAHCQIACERLKPLLLESLTHIPDMKEDESLDFTFFPDRLHVAKSGMESFEIKDPDFARMQLSTWLGSWPPSLSFQKGLLGLLP